jgi:hypothetical protein
MAIELYAVSSNLSTSNNICLDRGAGVVAFFGETQFSDGLWVGIILDEANGKNNGSVKDVKYFECEENHGTFVRPNTVHLEKSGRPTLSGLPRPNTRRTTNVSKPSSTATSVRSSPAVSINGSIMDIMSFQQTPKISPAVSMEQIKAQPVHSYHNYSSLYCFRKTPLDSCEFHLLPEFHLSLSASVHQNRHL